MNLHTCSHCRTPGLYDHAIKAEVRCHSCGISFTLTRFTQTEPTKITAMAEVARLKAMSVRSSRKLMYAASLVLISLLAWSAISMFGLIPDEWRLVNRRFASLDDSETLSQAVGLVAIGRKGIDGKLEFTEFFTATAISHDGFMLTAGSVATSGATAGMWVFVGGRRLDAEFVGVDSIADVGLIKVSENLLSRFRLAKSDDVLQLNDDVASAGFPSRVKGSTSPLQQSYSMSQGTISHVSRDETGTEWIDHSAGIDTGGIGGPLLKDGSIIGLNVGSQGIIMKAISIGPLRTRLLRMMDEARSD